MADAKDFYANVPMAMGEMSKQLPAVASGFMNFFGKIMAEGALGTKQKELIALGIAVASKCVPCIYMHTKKCVDAGATRNEILEAASVAVTMGGGPAFMHIMEVIDALDALGK